MDNNELERLLEKAKDTSLSSIRIVDSSNKTQIENNEVIPYNRETTIHPPKKEEYASISYKDIDRIRRKCDKAIGAHFPWSDIFNSGFTLCLGAVLGALASGLKYEPEFLNILFFSILPIAAAVCLVAFILTRKQEKQDIIELSQEIEEILPVINKDNKETDNESE